MNDNLTHFTNYEAFKGILLSKSFWPCYNAEEITHEMKTWYSDPDIEYQPLNVPMVCFCDSDVNNTAHIKTYNSFGIGFSKKWASKNGLCPVMYINRDSEITEILHKMFINNAVNYKKSRSKNEKSEVLENHNGLFWISLYTKPYEGFFFKTGKRETFYYEREWRYIPKLNKNQVEYSNNESVIKHRNNEVKDNALRFEYHDIQKIYTLENDCEEVK